jgi:hypothetical protein
MTQRHYLESVNQDGQLDPQFKSLLKHHWMEEAQHAKLDSLMIEALASGKSDEGIARSVEDYLRIVGIIDAALSQQVEFDLHALMKAIGRTFSETEKQQFREVQRQANRWTYLGSGMSHENVLNTLSSISETDRARVESLAAAYC